MTLWQDISTGTYAFTQKVSYCINPHLTELGEFQFWGYLWIKRGSIGTCNFQQMKIEKEVTNSI